MKILLTVAARGGSKGVKNKNIRPVCGMPLIGLTLLQAKQWGKADRIIVTTDSPEIAQVARTFGVEVPFLRPEFLATDETGKLPVWKHALLESEKIFGEQFDVVVDLDPTSPIRSSLDIENALTVFKEKKASSVFSVVRAQKNPYFNMVEIGDKGWAKLCKQLDSPLVRRQDAPAVYSMNASIYILERTFLMSDTTTVISERSAISVMDDLSSFDIDRDVDFKFLEFLIKEGLWQLPKS